MTIQVAVCGPSECTENELNDAHRLGKLLAQRGAVVLCGGYGGVMASVAAGARSVGGTTVGILSGGDRAGASHDLSIVIPTGLGQARNTVLVNSGDAVIVVGGSLGTLSELAFALRRGTVPVVQLGGWQVRDQHGDPLPGVRRAGSPAEAVRLTGLWT